jgi:GT2 family glycosyltransferase
VSVIIAAYDPPETFRRVLQAFACGGDGEGPSFEVLVVDNHPERTSERLVAPFLGESVRLFWEARRGKCRAVNRGIEAARGRVLHFTDQDNLPREGYLRSLWRLFREDPELAVLTGRVEPEVGAPTAGAALAIKQSPSREIHVHPFVPSVAGHGNNLSVRREVIDRVGRFDTRLGPGTYVGAGEDTDFIYRLARAGHPVVYDPTVCNLHAHGRDDAGSIRRTRGDYARGRGAFYLKHLRRGDAFVARLCYWELRACLKAVNSSQLTVDSGEGSPPSLSTVNCQLSTSSYPDPWLNLRGLLAGMAWMAWH